MPDLNTRIIITGQDRASEVWRRVGLEAEGFKRRLLDINQVAGGLLGGYALGRGLSAIEKQFAAWEQGLADMGNLTDEEASRIAERIRSLGPELGSARDLAAGYYQTVSAGVKDPARALETLAGAARAAKAAHVSQDEVVKVSTKLMKGYGNEIRDVADATDLLFAMEKEGQTTVRELVPYMGELANLSREAGVEVNEMGAGLATLTLTAGTTAEAATQYKAVLLSLYKPQERMLSVLEAMGYQSGAAMVRELGLAGALARVREYAERAGIPLGRLVESKEALIGYAALAANGFADFNERLGAMEQRAGATDRAFARWEKTWNGIKDTFENTVANVLVDLGEELAPSAKAGLTGVSDWLRDHQGDLVAWAGEVADFAAGAGKSVETLLTLLGEVNRAGGGGTGYFGLGDALDAGAMAGASRLALGRYGPGLAVSLLNKSFQEQAAAGLPDFSFSPARWVGQLGEIGGLLDEFGRRLPGILDGTRDWRTGELLVADAAGKITGEMDAALAKARALRDAAPLRVQTSAPRLSRARADADAGAGSGPPDPARTEAAARALERVNAEIAKLTLSPRDYALFSLDQEAARLAGVLGAANPKLAEYVRLKREDLDFQGRLAEYGRSGAADLTDFYVGSPEGEAAAARVRAEAEAEQERAAARNLEVLTSFDQEYRRVVQGETAFQAEQVEAQARVWREAGADAVRVAQWEAGEKLRLSRDWKDGAVLALRDYADEAGNAARAAGSVVGSMFSAMEQAGEEFRDKGSASFRQYADSVIHDIERILYRMSVTGPLAGALEKALGSIDYSSLFGSSGSLTAAQRSTMISNYQSTGSIARAKGGVIDEPVLGVGLASGRTWTFGEKGREWVTPGGQAPGGGNVSLTQYNDFRGADASVIPYLEARLRQQKKETVAAVADLARRSGAFRRNFS